MYEPHTRYDGTTDDVLEQAVNNSNLSSVESRAQSDYYVDPVEREPSSLEQYQRMLDYLHPDDPMAELLETRIEDMLEG